MAAPTPNPQVPKSSPMSSTNLSVIEHKQGRERYNGTDISIRILSVGSSEDSLRIPMPASQGFPGAAMRRVQDDAPRKNFYRALLSSRVTIVDRPPAPLFRRKVPPEEYDQTTLKFSGARKQAAFPARVVFEHHCFPASLNNSRPALSGGISEPREFASNPRFQISVGRHAGGKL